MIDYFRTNNMLAIKDGDKYEVRTCSDELYEKVRVNIENGASFDEVLSLLSPVDKQEVEQRKKVNSIANDSRFEVKGQSIYRVGVPVALPDHIIERYTQILDAKDINEFQKVDNFWFLCTLNPNADSRETCLKFMESNNIRLAPSGLMIVYRWLVKKDHSSKSFILNGNGINLYSNWTLEEFMNVFRRHKKRADKVFVDKVGNVTGSLKRNVGTVEDFLNLYNSSKGSSYTDKHTGRMRINLLEPARLERDKCDTNTHNSCSRGLHVAGLGWAKNYSFGDTSVVALVNPRDVVAVPNYDAGKMRVCEYFPCMEVDLSKVNEDTIDLKEYEEKFFDMTIDTTLNCLEEGQQPKDIENRVMMYNTVNLLDRISDIKGELTARLITN